MRTTEDRKGIEGVLFLRPQRKGFSMEDRWSCLWFLPRLTGQFRLWYVGS